MAHDSRLSENGCYLRLAEYNTTPACRAIDGDQVFVCSTLDGSSAQQHTLFAPVRIFLGIFFLISVARYAQSSSSWLGDTMSDWSMSELMDGIDFLLDDLDQVCRASHAKYRRYDAESLLEHDRRAAAACIYSHMAADAERRWPVQNLATFPERSGAPLQPIEVRGLKVWTVREMAILRFKKHDEDGKSRNYPTKQAKDYDRGSPLPGLPHPAARLSVGYLLDATGTEFVRTQIARPRGKGIEWCAAIVPRNDRAIGEKRWIDVTRQHGF
jgi:hypothetical protein